MQPFLFLDIETTGHEPLRRFDRIDGITLHKPLFAPYHEIIDIGAVWMNPETLHIIHDFEIKVTPQYPEQCIPNIINHYPERAARGEWDGAPYIDTALDMLFGEFEDFKRHHFELAPSNLIGQNFFFDWSFLLVAFASCGISDETIRTYFHYKKIDVASMAVQALLDEGEVYDPANFSLRSGRLQEKLGLPPEPEPHTALNGAYQAYYIFHALQKLKNRR